MLPIPGRYVVIALILGLILWFALTSNPQGELSRPELTSKNIRDLNSGSASNRRRAAEELIKAGQNVVPEIVTQIKQAPDRCRPLIHVLSDMTVLDENEAGEAALSAIEALTTYHHKEVADAAFDALSENFSIRRMRAIDHLSRLGAQVESVNDQFIGNSTTFEFVLLDERYTGGREGLKHLKRLNTLHVLYVSEKLDIPGEELAALRQWYPRLQISSEVNGCLGVIGAMPFGSNVVIDRIVPNSPAARVGLRPGDRILSIDDVENPTLRQMVAAISKHPPGEPVHVTILRRDEQFMSFRIRSGSDFGTGRCQCEINPSL
ncbi:PDZ domain-containing protein [Planctopirus hydrillae]|uniref:PDZ domain-containing protein n=1 Tax=Planctopirus hydrillae TaxID=1841610 RepID=A0A1C3EHB6_9PLAN|nr:PDZ domain-containing protein [Planctopirus hydrillae]ODA32624.1 hypothetical protein A6X21_19920 [Planctopirus hydrillae]